MEDLAVDVLGLKHVRRDIVGLIFNLGLAENLVGVQVGHHQGQLRILILKGLLGLQHLGGGGIDGDFLGSVGHFLLGHLIELLVGQVAPLVIVGAIVVFPGIHVVSEVEVLRGLAAIGGLLSVAAGGLAAAVLVAAAGGQAEDHGQGQQQCKELLFHQKSSPFILGDFRIFD